MKRVVVSALLGVTLIASTAHAQDQWERVVRNQLEQAGRISQDRGFRMDHDIFQGRLDDDATTDLTVNLDGGKSYVIVGVCDQDCTDVDLTIYNSNGDEVDSDLQTDDKPVLTFSAQRDGRYRIKVSMVRCSANPCRYGVGIWSKDGIDAGSSSANNSNNSSSSSSAGDRWESVVRDQLNRAGTVATDRGYAMSHEIFMGRLDDDANESLNIPLDGGTQYILVGTCDQDCTDVDLTIYDPNGKEVDSDLETDDKPVLTLTAGSTGSYRVKVSMVACTANPCRYGVGVWAK